MLSEKFTKVLKEQDFEFFSGVPDSTLKSWLYNLRISEDLEEIIATNEGEAIALCTGYYLATGKVGVVYMQNSGLGNAIDPLTSLVNKEVYKIPMLLIVGWRGEPNEKDEPQHKKMGKITLPLLNLLEIPYKVLNENNVESSVKEAKEIIENYNCPYVLVVKKSLFDDEPVRTDFKELMTREDAIKIIVDNLGDNKKLISTTGKTSRELFEYAKDKKQSVFYNVGAMGHTASIALGYARNSDKQVYVLDGDGSVLMHMGSLATIGYHKTNLVHIVFNNYSHDSTGGQPTVSGAVNFCEIAKNCGYKSAILVKDKISLEEVLKEVKGGPNMIVVEVKKGSREDLGRPTTTPVENKKRFMEL